MRILVLTPWVPWPMTGACQQDRFSGFLQMKELGHDIHVLARIHDFQDRGAIERAFREHAIPLTLFPHAKKPWKLALRLVPKMLATPALMDGAAIEYADPACQACVFDAIRAFKPDVLWMEYTTLWPLLRATKPFNIPTVMKSSLNEPMNCRDEHGHSFSSWLKSLPKFGGERIAATESDLVLAITPKEEAWYRSLGATETGVLPLRGLHRTFTKKVHKDRERFNVVLLSSNYNMGHNRDAARFFLGQVIPKIREAAPGRFRFFLTGKKFPASMMPLVGDDTTVTGFIDDFDAFLADMDIAVAPSQTGQGMQQKVFEPLCRSLPLVTTHTAGYPFVDGEEVLLAPDAETFAVQVLSLQDAAKRQRLADAAYAKAQTLFSKEATSAVVRDALTRVTR